VGTVRGVNCINYHFLIIIYCSRDEEAGDLQQQRANNSALGNVGQNPFLDPPELATAVEYKKGYVMRKCCYDSSYKKSEIYNDVMVEIFIY